jgi:hypothetical protein
MFMIKNKFNHSLFLTFSVKFVFGSIAILAPALLWRGAPLPESSEIHVEVVGKADSTTFSTRTSFDETQE